MWDIRHLLICVTLYIFIAWSCRINDKMLQQRNRKLTTLSYFWVWRLIVQLVNMSWPITFSTSITSGDCQSEGRLRPSVWPVAVWSGVGNSQSLPVTRALARLSHPPRCSGQTGACSPQPSSDKWTQTCMCACCCRDVCIISQLNDSGMGETTSHPGFIMCGMSPSFEFKSLLM